jgi:hypothetical protein
MSLLPEYRAQLYTAAQRRARRRPVLRLARSWPVAVSTVVAVGVVAVAVAALSHRHAPSAPTSTQPAASTAQLTGMLGVLRRPQTTADLSGFVPAYLRAPVPRDCITHNPRLSCTLRVDKPLIRQVVVPGSAYRVGLIPLSIARTGAGVAVTLRGPGIYDVADGPWRGGASGPFGLTAIRTRGALLSAYAAAGIDRGVIVVPDGVARVVIGPVHLLDTAITARFTPTAGATAGVHDNVALFQLSGLTVQNLELRTHALARFFSSGSGHGCRINFAVYALPATAIMTWFGPNGRLVNHVRINLPLYVGTHHPAPGTTTRIPRCAATG